MAEGGEFDHTGLNTVEPHDGDDGESMEMRRTSTHGDDRPTPASRGRYRYGRDKETSFGGTPVASRRIRDIDERREEAANLIKEKFPGFDPRRAPVFFGIDEHGITYITLLNKGSVRHYILNLSDAKISRLPKTIKTVLGITNKTYGISGEVQGLRDDIDLTREHVDDIVEDVDEIWRGIDDFEQEVEMAKNTSHDIRQELNELKIKVRVLTGDLETEMQGVSGTMLSIFKSIEELDERLSKGISELKKKLPNTVGEERKKVVEQIENGERQRGNLERLHEKVRELMPLKERVKAIFKKYGLTVVGVSVAVGTVIGVIVSNLKSGLAKVAKGVGDGLKDLGKKLGEILPGMIGAIASFLFKTAGEAIGFLAKNAWLLIVAVVVYFVERYTKKRR